MCPRDSGGQFCLFDYHGVCALFQVILGMSYCETVLLSAGVSTFLWPSLK